MEAYVSGMRGFAVLDDGGHFFALEPGQKEARPISHQGAMILLDDCRDLEKLLPQQVEEVEERLKQAIAEQKTLQAGLFLLDGQLPIELRQKIAQSLDLYLAEESLKAFLGSTLFARPLPGDADLAGAKVAAEDARLVAAFLAELEELQPTISEVGAAWEVVSAKVFGEEAQRWMPVLVREGIFRRIVLLVQAGRSVPDVLAEVLSSPQFRRLVDPVVLWRNYGSKSRSYQDVSFVAEQRGVYDAARKREEGDKWKGR